MISFNDELTKETGDFQFCITENGIITDRFSITRLGATGAIPNIYILKHLDEIPPLLKKIMESDCLDTDYGQINLAHGAFLSFNDFELPIVKGFFTNDEETNKKYIEQLLDLVRGQILFFKNHSYYDYLGIDIDKVVERIKGKEQITDNGINLDGIEVGNNRELKIDFSYNNQSRNVQFYLRQFIYSCYFQFGAYPHLVFGEQINIEDIKEVLRTFFKTGFDFGENMGKLDPEYGILVTMGDFDMPVLPHTVDYLEKLAIISQSITVPAVTLEERFRGLDIDKYKHDLGRQEDGKRSY